MKLTPAKRGFGKFFLIVLGIYTIIITSGYLLATLIVPYLIKLFAFLT